MSVSAMWMSGEEHSRAGTVAGTSGHLESKRSECHEEEREVGKQCRSGKPVGCENRGALLEAEEWHLLTRC